MKRTTKIGSVQRTLDRQTDRQTGRKTDERYFTNRARFNIRTIALSCLFCADGTIY